MIIYDKKRFSDKPEYDVEGNKIHRIPDVQEEQTIDERLRDILESGLIQLQYAACKGTPNKAQVDWLNSLLRVRNSLADKFQQREVNVNINMDDQSVDDLDKQFKKLKKELTELGGQE